MTEINGNAEHEQRVTITLGKFVKEGSSAIKIVYVCRGHGCNGQTETQARQEKNDVRQRRLRGATEKPSCSPGKNQIKFQTLQIEFSNYLGVISAASIPKKFKRWL